MVKTRFALVTALAASLAVNCANVPTRDIAHTTDPELLHTAMQQLTEVMVYDIFSPPQASRAYAYASIAAYEALRHAEPGFASLAGQVNALASVPAPDATTEYDFGLAGVHAFLTVGKALTFSQERVDSLRSAIHDRTRSAGVPRRVFRRSIAYGDLVAQRILDWAAHDHFVDTRAYPKFTVTGEPGRWVPTTPAYMSALEPNWSRVRPFVLDAPNQFQPAPPPAFDMTEGSPFFREVAEVFEVRNRVTDEKREIAHFWDDNPYVMHLRGHAMFTTKKATPGGHWISITRIAARRAQVGLVESAEAYARVAMALADGFISCWDEKYRSELVRPVTVIRSHFDEQWEPVLQTPPFPEYTSGHSVISTAAATVLTDQFGADFAFADSSVIAYGLPVRRFASFEEAAAEAAISRLYGGIHYRMAIEQGIEQGRKVGEYLLERVRTRSDEAFAGRAAAKANDYAR